MATKEHILGSRRNISANDVSAVIGEQTVRILVDHYGSDLRAIVLTGSIARDEGTFAWVEGHCKLLGDADFFVVFHDGVRLPARSHVDDIASEIRSSLSSIGIIADVAFSPVDGAYLRGLPRRISTYELLSCGRVVWGQSDICLLIPPFSPREIMLEDAWRMLGNRIIELIEAVANESMNDSGRSPEAKYKIVKLYLDMATSYLVFTGDYAPTYRQREQALVKRGQVPADEALFPLPLFSERVGACTRVKLGELSIDELPDDLFTDARYFARLLWNWELARLTLAVTEANLMELWMQQQPVTVRLRGWLSALYRSDWRTGCSLLSRCLRLGWRASPRYWTYGVAAELFFSRDFTPVQRSTNALDVKKLTRALPLSANKVGVANKSEWQAAVELTALNYHRLLETTAA